MSSIKILLMKVHQRIGDFYVGVMNAKELYAISHADQLRVESLEVPRFMGIQRALDKSRVKKIAAYLENPRSTFPSAIVLSLNSLYILSWENLSDNPDLSTIEIESDSQAMEIIDGQHRVAALNKADESFQVIVSIFIDLNTAERAGIFEKINSTQKPVNPSIAFQLFGYFEYRSPQRTAHDIAQTMQQAEGSPFHNGLRLLGTKDDWSGKVYLSQAAFCKELMRLFSKDPESDQNKLMRDEEMERDPKNPARSWFIDGQDDKILELVWKYFENVKHTWKDQWADDNAESVLRKTTGYSAFMEVLKAWLLSDRKNEVINNKGVREAMDRIRDKYTTNETRFIRENYPAGNQGKKKLRDSLMRDLGLS